MWKHLIKYVYRIISKMDDIRADNLIDLVTIIYLRRCMPKRFDIGEAINEVGVVM